jgi:peptidyl-prolyl cis-trans isomerase SurA
MPRPGRLAGLVVVAAVLAGCGDVNPGVAVRAGEESISVNEVDELTGEYCDALQEQLETNGQVVPLRYFRGGIAGVLAQRSVAEQVADEYAVEPGSVYDEKVSQLERSVRVLDEDVRDAVVTVESASAYVEGVQAAVGKAVLAEEGAPGAKYTEQVARGKKVFEDWVSEHGVSFDPQLGIAMVKGDIQTVDTSVSYAVGEDATAGAAEQPDPAYAKSLPDAHRCG